MGPCNHLGFQSHIHRTILSLLNFFLHSWTVISTALIGLTKETGTVLWADYSSTGAERSVYYQRRHLEDLPGVIN